MSDDTDDDVPLGQPSSRRKIKKRVLSSDSSSGSSTNSSPILRTKRKANYRVVSDDSDSDSDSFCRSTRKKKKVALFTSDSEDDSDGSDLIILRKSKRKANIVESDAEYQEVKSSSSQWETDESDNEEKVVKKKKNSQSVPSKNGRDLTDYGSGGEQAEECPICLLPIRKQEVGTPESCNHLFCLACILEWSKNVNTCPIDRQEYRLLFVKDKSNGKIIKRLPIEKPAPPAEPQDDPICCEICGSGEREDRLLLCDGCDLGFHLECLTPALDEVPLGSWYCNVCRPEHSFDREYSPVRYFMPNEELIRILRVNMGPRRRDNRLIPRTSQTERVISRILNHRSTTEQVAEQSELPSSSSFNEITQENLGSSISSRGSRRLTDRRKKKPKSKRKPRKMKYRMVYEIDELTGDVISKKKQVRRKKSRRKARSTVQKTPKTVKERLAQQLGICSKQLPNQSIPDVRVQGSTGNLNDRRHQAGIPTLHLFGQRDEIDYFSASDEDIGGPDYLVRRRANHSDVAVFRRTERRKGVCLPRLQAAPVTSSVSDILGSIMESQSQFFSKNSKLSVDKSGEIKIVDKSGKSNNNKPDLKDFNNLTKKTPYGGNNRNNGRRNHHQPYTHNPYQGNSYYPYDNYRPSSTSGNYRPYSNSRDNRNSGAGGYDPDVPQDYTQSTLSSYDRDIDSENPPRNEQGEDSDIDIYSDIEESVSTTKTEEDVSMKPLNLTPSVAADPAPPNNGSDLDNENNDSENDMVIDTEKVQTPTQDEEEETVKEETAVTSSEDSVVKADVTDDAAVGLHSTSDSQLDPVESSFNRSREEEEEEDEDGCPNFSIYSTESINLAKNTDISLNNDQNNDVVSSTPLPEPPKPPAELIGEFDPDGVYDPEFAYDPEASYNSEKGSDVPPEEVYDPEHVFDTPEDTFDQEKNDENNGKDENVEKDCERKEDPNVTPLNDELPEPETVEGTNELSEEVNEQTVVENDPKDHKDEEEERKDEQEEQKYDQPSPSKENTLKSKNPNTLYSDSEDEEIVKISQNSFIVGDISTMTEDVSEEERSYTPCLDEKSTDKGKGIEDLGTEMISDDERNDFDESHEHKTASEGDALEINAKESEIDMIRPEDYEEGEIVDKNKSKKDKQEENSNDKEEKDATETPPKTDAVVAPKKKDNKKEEKKNENKEKQESFKKLSKSNKERNYRDKERGGSKAKEDNSKNKERGRRKDKRKEIERYDVRALIAEKPRRLKDKFGRDIRKSSSRSRSRSYTPKVSPERRTPPKRRPSSDSRERNRKKRSRSRRRSSESRSKSRQRQRSLSRSRRRRSRSRSKRREKKKSKDRSKRRKRNRSPSRTNTPNRKRRKEWKDRYSRERAYSAEPRWTPSLSRSPEVEPTRLMSPSWTPPRVMESAAVDPRGLTVILQNDQNKKKREKRKKNGKKGREIDKRTKRKKKEHTPPSKEVFASGDNILVSVSFNKENERRERDVFTKKKKEAEDREKKKRSMRRKKKNQELSTIKPVAIIDLERSPFRELTPSPKDIIVLSDEDHVENNATEAQDVCDSSQQVASPENVPVYMTGPKTPPEPQVKFSLPSKQTTLRPLMNNPLHDPEDEIAEDQEQEEEDREMHELNDSYKGPNTPPEPPNSPPSSPDAYDPFEPTKSRSPSPDKGKTVIDESDKRNSINDITSEKNTVVPSLTPPIADVQPADSQSSLLISRDSSKSPEQVGRSVKQSPNKSAAVQPTSNALTSTPLPSTGGAQRINILSSTILGNVSSTIPQRSVLPNIKLSPVKISPVKNVVKSTPIKPMPIKGNGGVASGKSKGKQQNGAGESNDVISLEFDSPYSPGSSDYEDLFEPPPEVVTKKTFNKSVPSAASKDAGKPKNAFDSLFDAPVNKMKKMSMDKSKSKRSKGTKIVGVKLDEDHLKILDELPNSAVEMQVKDKFLKKLNRQERVVEEVKLVLKPYYNKKKIDKEEYKDIMRRAVPKICHNKSGEINPTRIKNLIEAYVKKIRHAKPKVTSSSSYNPLKG